MSPVISLLTPCSDFRPEAIYSSLYQRMDAIEPLGGANSLYFSLLSGISAETGSPVTASTASQSAAKRIYLSTLLRRPVSGFFYFRPYPTPGSNSSAAKSMPSSFGLICKFFCDKLDTAEYFLRRYSRQPTRPLGCTPAMEARFSIHVMGTLRNACAFA
jgi:hypothetical protein